jgi:uncharacterized membrane protein
MGMKKQNNELRQDLLLLGLVVFLVVTTTVVMYGADFYNISILVMDYPVDPYEVASWFIAGAVVVVFGIKALINRFKNIITNSIVVVFGMYLFYEAMYYWNEYNELTKLIAPFENN